METAGLATAATVATATTAIVEIYVGDCGDGSDQNFPNALSTSLVVQMLIIDR